jgi:hypothetical protein
MMSTTTTNKIILDTPEAVRYSQPAESHKGEGEGESSVKKTEIRRSAIIAFILIALIFCLLTSIFVWKSGVLSKDLFKASNNAAASSISTGITSNYNDSTTNTTTTTVFDPALLANLTMALKAMQDKVSDLESKLSDLKNSKAEVQNVTNLENRFNSVQTSLVPVGSVHWFPNANAPQGFLKLNGARVSRTLYSALWSYAQASGNLASSEASKKDGQFGPGDGTNTFSLPDLRGLVVRSLDEGKGHDANRALGSFQDSQNKQHSHGVNEVAHSHGVNDPGHSHSNVASGVSVGYRNAGGANGGYVGSVSLNFNGWTAASHSGISIQSAKTGGITILQDADGGAETRVKNVALLACIKF